MSLFDRLQGAKTDKAAANLKEGEDFLKENAAKEGVHTTASGLQYQVLKEGNGPKPKCYRYSKMSLSWYAYQRNCV